MSVRKCDDVKLFKVQYMICIKIYVWIIDVAQLRPVLMTPLIYRKLAYSAQKHLRSELIFLIFFYVDRNAKTIEQENK